MIGALQLLLRASAQSGTKREIANSKKNLVVAAARRGSSLCASERSNVIPANPEYVANADRKSLGHPAHAAGHGRGADGD